MLKMIKKACPIVLHQVRGQMHFLGFRHPQAGLQLVKGTIESEESAESAARRELFEESGLDLAQPFQRIGTTSSIVTGEEWSIFQVQATGLRETWLHRTADGGGLEFAFFWHKLDAPLNQNWHSRYRRAIAYFKDWYHRQ